MDKETQYVAAIALVVLGVYSLIYTATMSVPYRAPVVVGCFWVLAILAGSLAFRIRTSPFIAFPAFFVTLCVVLPTTSTALEWTAALIRRMLS